MQVSKLPPLGIFVGTQKFRSGQENEERRLFSIPGKGPAKQIQLSSLLMTVFLYIMNSLVTLRQGNLQVNMVYTMVSKLLLFLVRISIFGVFSNLFLICRCRNHHLQESFQRGRNSGEARKTRKVFRSIILYN